MYVHVLLDRSGRAFVPPQAARDGISGGGPEPAGLSMLLCSPDAVDLTIGAVRDVAAFVEVDRAALASLLTGPARPFDETIRAIAIMVHRVSRRAVAVGPFVSALEARAWWASRGNRLAANAAMVFVIVTLASGPAS